MSSEIVQATAKSPVALTDAGFVANDLEGAFRIAQVMVKAGIAGKHSVESATIAIGHGRALGLNAVQAVQNIAVVNGKPAAYGDAPLGIARSSGKIEALSEVASGKEDGYGWTCTIKRKGEANLIVRSFTIRDAKRAGLWGKAGPWTQYPDRMLMYRARGWALRDAVPDALLGLAIGEEAEDIPPPKAVENVAGTKASRLAVKLGVAEAPSPPAPDAPMVEEAPNETHDSEITQ